MIKVLKQMVEALNYVGYSYTTCEEQEQADAAKQAGLDAIVKLESQEPVALQMDVIVVNLVREGINKHRARELAEHFIKHTNPPQRTETIQSLQCFHCQVTIETLNDKVMHLMSQRTWVGLTDEEFWELDKEDLSLRQFVQAIDDKLKEKNT